MTALVPGAVYKPVVNGYNERNAQRGLVLHVQAGNGDLYGWFNNPASEASSEWQVRKNGDIIQFLDPDVESGWTQGTGNTYWCAVETEGQPSEPLTAAQIEGVARILAWGHKRYGWPLQLTNDPNGKGFGWHGMGGQAWGGHTGCPGEPRKSQMPAILARAKQLVTPKPTVQTMQATAPTATQVQEDDMKFIRVPNGTIYALTAGRAIPLVSMGEFNALAKVYGGGFVNVSEAEAATIINAMKRG